MEVISEILDGYGWSMAVEVPVPPEHRTTPMERALFFAGEVDDILNTALTGLCAKLHPGIFALHAELSCVLISMIESAYDRRDSRDLDGTLLVWCQIAHGSGRVSLVLETAEGTVSEEREFMPIRQRA